MFIGLLAVTFIIALVVSALIALLFAKPVKRIMTRIVPDEISGAWVRYLTFAIFVVGVGGGVRINQIERYVTPQSKDMGVLELTPERWVIEVYSTVIGTLGAIAWMLLVFFVFALVAYVIVRAFEMKHRDLAPHHAGGAGPEERAV
jgi:tellurite resistance protein TehA-like permease